MLRTSSLHVREKRIPEFAFAHLLSSVCDYLATDRPTTPPIPAYHVAGSIFDGDLGDEHETPAERLARHREERVWAPYAFP